MVCLLWLTLLLQTVQGGRPSEPPARASIQGIVVRAGASGAGAPPELADARVELTPDNVSVVTGPGGRCSPSVILRPADTPSPSVTTDSFRSKTDGAD
jgi:hypothetical protein